MTDHRNDIDEQVGLLMAQYAVTGTVTEGGPPSRVYNSKSRVFSTELKCEGRREMFAVYTGVLHPGIDLTFALRWLIDTASQAQEETYERWLQEDGSDYLETLGEELTQLLYEEGHETGRKLKHVLGEQAYRALAEAVRG